MLISLIHPSRNRPEQAEKTFLHWIGNMSAMSNLSDYVISVDLDDKDLETYKSKFMSVLDGIILVGSNNTCVVEAANVGAKQAKGDILVLVSDDFECHKDWDLHLIEHFTNHKNNVLKTNDTLQDWIVTLPIMDREYYESCGYMYHPSYKHMFCDTDMTHKAELEGRLFKRMDLEFKHKHYSQGETPKDEVNIKADSTWAQGETVYLDRVRNSFDIPNVDALSISDVNLKNWLIQKLK